MNVIDNAVVVLLIKKTICLMGVTCVLGLCSQAQAFVLTGSSWVNGEEAITVNLAVTNPPGANQPNIVPGGPSTTQLNAAYIEAMDLWTTNSVFQYVANTSGGVVDPCSGSDSGVKFATSPCSGSFSATTLAVQTTYFNAATNFNTRTITVFNNNKQWDIYTGPWTGVAEFKRVAVHELGHGLGLDHSIAGSIMYFQAGNTEIPQADDLAGAAALYDTDADGIGLAVDNCPDDSNAGQEDADVDGVGDACDGDIDGDGVFNAASVDVSHGVSPVGSSLYAAGPASSNSAFPYMAQTFQAGITGNLLRVDLPVFCPSGNMLLEIRDASGGQPTSNVIASDNFLGGSGVPTSSSGVQPFSLSAPPSVISGNQYAVVLTVSSECRWFTASSYTGGAGYLSTNASFWQSIGDFAFQTYIDPFPVDNCPLVANPLQEDANSNGVGDACELPDQDSDGVEDTVDNCPAVPNPLQEDFDTDGQGDACDTDDDNDGLIDSDETTLYGTNPLNPDTDGDGFSDGEEVQAGTDPNVADLNVPFIPLFAMFVLAVVMRSIARVKAG